jgi:hypothetical protein
MGREPQWTENWALLLYFVLLFVLFFSSAMLNMVMCDPAVAAVFFLKMCSVYRCSPVYIRVLYVCLFVLPFSVRWIVPKNVIEKQKSVDLAVLP